MYALAPKGEIYHDPKLRFKHVMKCLENQLKGST